MKTAAERKASAAAKAEQIYETYIRLLRVQCQREMDKAESIGKNGTFFKYSYPYSAAEIVAKELRDKGYEVTISASWNTFQISWR